MSLPDPRELELIAGWQDRRQALDVRPGYLAEQNIKIPAFTPQNWPSKNNMTRHSIYDL